MSRHKKGLQYDLKSYDFGGQKVGKLFSFWQILKSAALPETLDFPRFFVLALATKTARLAADGNRTMPVIP